MSGAVALKATVLTAELYSVKITMLPQKIEFPTLGRNYTKEAALARFDGIAEIIMPKKSDFCTFIGKKALSDKI